MRTHRVTLKDDDDDNIDGDGDDERLAKIIKFVCMQSEMMMIMII